MNKTYTASYIFDGEIKVRDFEGYSSKKALASFLRANGMKVKVIAESDKFDEEVTKYQLRNERRNDINRYARQALREFKVRK